MLGEEGMISEKRMLSENGMTKKGRVQNRIEQGFSGDCIWLLVIGI
jgi:hypothetical protein